MPRPNTHLAIDPRWSGRPTALAPGRANVELETRPEMAADERGLVHGGFVFGCADYAAMLAIDEPLVVLAAAEVRFLAPVTVGETLIAEAAEEASPGRARTVRVTVRSGEIEVFQGRFDCAVPKRHVLDRAATGEGA